MKKLINLFKCCAPMKNPEEEKENPNDTNVDDLSTDIKNYPTEIISSYNFNIESNGIVNSHSKSEETKTTEEAIDKENLKGVKEKYFIF
jgi:hypothetical protein